MKCSFFCSERIFTLPNIMCKIKRGAKMDLSKYASQLPYPDVDVDKNVAESKLLMPVYCGSSGELTAIATYCFQSYVSPKYPNIQDALEGIAMVEMHHHELLGKTIYKLGGYPVMGARTYWNGSFANYTLDPRKYLKENVLAEQNAIMNYERTILNLTSDSVKMLLERIILDEELHIKIFKDLLKEYFDVECEKK